MSRPVRTVLIANRGEIAVRIARACADLGIRSVAVYSDADASAPHVHAADEAVHIGPAAAADSYLSIERIVGAALVAGADAIHPGYGFLSEDPRLPRAVEAAGLVFIGPPADTLEHLGNKLQARRAATRTGVPVVPGLELGPPGSEPEKTEALGLPLMVKAAAGGGGRGMRRVDRAADLPAAVAAASREAEAAFGDGTVYVERLLTNVRHVEVQLVGDQHGRVACVGERECSVQRRHQKLIEETPSPAVDERLREALFDSALTIARSVRFHSAATAEFLVDAQGNHYFLELNARLQVEHGITELVSGLDLVALQIAVAAGERLPASAEGARSRGHAIEARVYAEDPYDGFRPTPGRVTVWQTPSGPGVRVDAGMTADTDLPSEYDALLAKVMVLGADRPQALRRMRRALDETLVGGVQTTLGFLRWTVDDSAFVAGRYDTGFLAERWGSGPPLGPLERDLAAALAAAGRHSAPRSGEAAHPRTSGDGAVGTDNETAWARQARRDALRPRTLR